MNHRLELPSHIRFIFFKVCQNELEFVYSFRAIYSSCSGQASPLSLLANVRFLPMHPQMDWCAVAPPPIPVLKFLAEKRSVKTGYLYFYWFLQTMTTFPERQCQETINVCEEEVKVLMSIILFLRMAKVDTILSLQRAWLLGISIMRSSCS